MPAGMTPGEGGDTMVGVVDIVSKVIVNHNSHHPGKNIIWYKGLYDLIVPDIPVEDK
jgi:hypothetical protein